LGLLVLTAPIACRSSVGTRRRPRRTGLPSRGKW
jgi:hypothetical protein